MDKSKLVSRLKPPTVEFMKKVAPPSASSTIVSNSQKNTGVLSSLAARKTRRSKSFCVFKSSVRPALKPSSSNSNLLNKPLIAEYPGTSGKTTGVSKTAMCTNTTNQLKSAQKRPAEALKQVSAPKLSKFDFKGRLALLDEKYKALIKDHKEVKSKCQILEEENLCSKTILEENTKQLHEYEQYKLSTADVFNKLKESEKHNGHLQQLCQMLQSELDKTTKQYEVLENDNNILHNTLTKLKTEKCLLEKQVIELKNSLERAGNSAEEYKRLLRDHDTLRRRLHNDIQDLKGNIRVFCRVRPLTLDESDKMSCNLDFADDTCTVELRKCSDLTTGRDKIESKFTFDKVFPGESSQAEVFDELAQLVQSTVDGYNVCVFAYGQTGSGKTFTMLGDTENIGMIPRSVDLLFMRITELEKLGWSYEVQVNFLEIYNESIKDLLNPDSKKAHDILYNEGKGSVVTNLQTQTVCSTVELKKLMKKANNNRAIAATNFNLHSSRSHAVTKISVRGCYEHNVFHGSLNLVDLAGSESAKHSDRMTETKNINKSLSSLGTVILALNKKDHHVPYRNSKLTYLLQSSLGGNSKTLMFVNISPLEECYYESLNSLRFASKIKEVKITSKRTRTIIKS